MLEARPGPPLPAMNDQVTGWGSGWRPQIGPVLSPTDDELVGHVGIDTKRLFTQHKFQLTDDESLQLPVLPLRRRAARTPYGFGQTLRRLSWPKR